MRFLSRGTLFFAVLTIAFLANVGLASAAVTLNEIRIDQSGADNDEYCELKGTPSESLAGLSLIVIGDATSAGLGGAVECIVDLGSATIQADGFYLMAEATFTLPGTVDLFTNLNFENSDNLTFLLVSGRNDSLNTGDGFGGGGSDIDQNDDGIIDATGDWGGDGIDDGPPWTSIVDCVAFVETVGSGDLIYCTTTVGPDGFYVPGQAYACPDIAGTWKIGDFNLGVTDTPDAPNLSCLSPAPEFADETRDPCVPAVSQGATVGARVLNATGANLHYTVNGGIETVMAMAVGTVSGDTTDFSAVIPGQGANGTLVEYYVRAYNANPDSTSGHDQGYFVGTTPIGTLRVNDVDGRNVYYYYGARINGNVSCPPGVYQTTNTDYYVQDATGGINVFQFGLNSVVPGLGDDVTVSGILDQYNGKLELAPGGPCDTLLVDINGPGSPPSPEVVSTCDFGEDYEGKLVKFQFATLVDNPDTLFGDTNYRISNCIPDTTVLRPDGTSITSVAATSQYVEVIGIAGQFDSSAPYDTGYQLLPRYASDITFLASTDVRQPSTKPVARLMQNYPNPFSRSTQITYTVPAKAAEAQVPVKVRVFDVQGRVLATLVDGMKTPGDHTVNLSREALGVGNGIYFYQLEVGDQTITKKLVLVQ